MSQYFSKPYEPFGGDINVKVGLSNYAMKTDIKNFSHVDTSSFAWKSNLASLRTEVDKLDIDKLEAVPVNLSKLSDAVTKYDTDKIELESKIPETSGLVKKANAKITEIEGKIPSISGLATNAALTTVENKIPNISSLVKKTDYDTKITEIEKKHDNNHDKNTANPEFNTLAADVFNARLAETNSITKKDFDAKLQSLNRKITANKIKHLLVDN